MIGRRYFITGLGVVAWPLMARAQQSAIPAIGFIGERADGRFNPAFFKGLSETGYADGRNVAIEYRWVEGHNERLPSFVKDLIGRGVSVIAVPNSTAAALAAKAATTTIPIVFRIGGDPVSAGLVASFNRPGGNVTGITTQTAEPSKRLQLVRELSPTKAPIAFLVNPTNANVARTTTEVQRAADILDVPLLVMRAGNSNEIETAFASLTEIGGLTTQGDPLFFQERKRIVDLVARRAIPAVYTDRIFVEAGGLMAYGTDIADGLRLAGVYTGRILKGEKPADLPVQRSTKVELVINLKTAKTLGLTIPETLLATADEVIQ